VIVKKYTAISPTVECFHKSDAQARCIVGAVGTGKTTAAIWEIGFNLPRRIYMMYGIAHTKWLVVRKTYEQLMDTDFQEAMDWFVQGEWRPSRKNLRVKWPASVNCPSPLIVDLIFHSCNTPEEEGKFRSMNVTGAWIDEADQLSILAKNIIKGRLGRFPKRKETPVDFVPRYLVETSNPFPADHIMYTTYDWMGPECIQEAAPQMKCVECGKTFSMSDTCPVCGAPGEPTGKRDWRTGKYNTDVLVKKLPRGGPVPTIPPTPDHVGFWQEAGENEENLRPGYWDSIRRDYQEAPEMVKIMVEGEPGYKPKGKPVYRNFDKDVHMARSRLVWKQVRDSYTGEMRGVPLLCGWDFSGNFPAAVVIQRVAPMSYQVLREFYDDRMQAVDFGKWVLETLNIDYAGYEGTHFADPASWAEYSSATGGFTSNAIMVQEQCGIQMTPSRQELDLRISAVDQLLIRRGGLLIDPQCFMILNGFVGGYVREENPRLGDKNYKDQPIKNNFSHVHDALQYALVTEIYPKVREPRQDIADEEALIESYPERMTARSSGPVNKRIIRGKDGTPLEPQYSQTHDAQARGWDPRRSSR
jgi:hypothetical protein